jgi:hypothetical protein
MNSGPVLAGTEGVTIMTIGARAMPAELLIVRAVNRVRCGNHEHRMAVRRSAHSRLGGDIAIGTRPVLDHKLMAERLRQPLSYQPRLMSVLPPAAKPTMIRTRVG